MPCWTARDELSGILMQNKWIGRKILKEGCTLHFNTNKAHLLRKKISKASCCFIEVKNFKKKVYKINLRILYNFYQNNILKLENETIFNWDF